MLFKARNCGEFKTYARDGCPKFKRAYEIEISEGFGYVYYNNKEETK